MAKLLKLRRGTTSQHSSFTGAEGEVTVDTTKDTIVVHDGSTAGGIPLARFSDLGSFITDVVNDTSPQLGGNLDVNTKNIILDDSSDGTTDDVIKFGAGTDLSIYSNGTEGIFGIPDGGTLKIKDGTNTMATFSGASNQLDIGVHTVFIGASSNASWDKANNRFSGTITEVNVTANNSTDETVYPTFVDGATGSQGIETDTGLSYNPSTGLLSTAAVTTTGNVIIGGDLTVSGTTTTVNSTTLEVADKNIELGKVSTPTDTTADGGGITLKGASDKTFNWVDATDAWTSSEHIHLGDNKKLFVGDGSDLHFIHNGTDSYLQNITGDLYIQNTTGTADDITITAADDVYIRSQAGEASIHCKGDGGVDIYHDATRKMYTSADGITVEGSVTDDKGDVRKIIQNTQGSSYTLVAADAGKHILASGTVTIPDSVFAAGDAVTIVNNTGSNLTITKTITTMYNAADGTSANRTLGNRGMATILFVSGTVSYISGSGLT